MSNCEKKIRFSSLLGYYATYTVPSVNKVSIITGRSEEEVKQHLSEIEGDQITMKLPYVD